MAGGNVSPRQKMINMMYLVLTALLALNVSAEILNAFKLVKGSLEKTNEDIELSIGQQKASMQGLSESNPNNIYIPVFTKLNKSLEDEIMAVESFIVELDTKVADASGGKDDDTESTDRLLAEGAEGDELEAQLASLAQTIQGYSLAENLQGMKASGAITSELYDQFLYKYTGAKADYDFEAAIQGALTYNLTIDDPEAETTVWHEYNFRGVPAIGARTILTKLLSDLKTMKKAIGDITLTGAKNSTTQKVVFYPVVSTNGSFFNVDQPFNVTINVGSYDPAAMKTNDSTKIPEFYQGTYTAEFQAAINARDKIIADGGVLDDGAKSVPSFSGWPFVEAKKELVKTPDGNGFYTENVKGDKTIQGAMFRDGIWYDWQTEYKLQTSGDNTYQLDKLKVMFAGVANPITVSMGAATVTGVSCSWGKVKKVGNGKFEIIPKSVTKGKTKESRTLTAKGTDQGKSVSQEFTFEVRDFPPPTARHKGAKAGDTELTRKQVGEFKNGISTIVATPDDNSLASLFDAKFKVVDFEIAFQKPGDGQYSATPEKIGTMAGKLEGATLTIRKIKAIDPSGKKVDLDSRVYIVTK